LSSKFNIRTLTESGNEDESLVCDTKLSFLSAVLMFVEILDVRILGVGHYLKNKKTFNRLNSINQNASTRISPIQVYPMKILIGYVTDCEKG
jgi:hypothetical protein